MSESPFPFGTRTTDTSAEEAEQAGRRPLALALAGLAVVALAGGYLLLGGDEPAEEAVVAVAGAPRAVAPVEPADPVEPQEVPVAFDGVIGKNPFKALVSAPAGGGGADAAATATTVSLGAPTTLVEGSSSGSSGTSGTVTPPTSSTGTTRVPPPAPATVPTEPVQTAPRSAWIEMPPTDEMTEEELKKHLADGTWRFSVASTAGSADVEEHVVKPGATFADVFQLVRLVYRSDAGQCAELRFGEQPFWLCGEDSIQF